MLKCKHNEDCSLYPHCGHTCGVPVEELLRRQSQKIRDMRFQMNQATYQLSLIEMAVAKAKKEIKEPDYIPSCPCGFTDCVSDPAYIQKYNPKHWEELGMPTSCDDLHYGKSPYEADERGYFYCQWYDDEDK